MDVTITDWLSAISGTVFQTCAALFVVLNVGAAGLFLSTRSRAMVQRWTSPWLAANLLLIGAGAGVPLVAGIAKAAVNALAGAPPVVLEVNNK